MSEAGVSDQWWSGQVTAVGSGTVRSGAGAPGVVGSGPARPEDRMPSGWSVAIDFGTTATAAAIVRGAEVDLVRFGSSTRMPSGVFVDPDEGLLCSSTALNRGGADPGRYVRTPKRHVGRDEHVLVGGQPVPVRALVAQVVATALEAATAQAAGGAPDHVVLTHPARWGLDARRVLLDAATDAGVDPARVVLVPEPVAAGHDAATAQPGSCVAVYDLGGGTFDAVVLTRRDDGSWAIAGRPGGIDPMGGESIDAMLHRHLLARVEQMDPAAARTLDAPSTAAERGLRRTWWRDLRALKEELSDTTSSVIAVPGTEHSVLVSRAELEELVAHSVAASVDELVTTIRSSSVGSTTLSEVLLCGDASRMPIVARLVSAELPDVPVRIAADPKGVVARGAVAASLASAADADSSVELDTGASTSVAPESVAPTGPPRDLPPPGEPESQAQPLPSNEWQAPPHWQRQPDPPPDGTQQVERTPVDVPPVDPPPVDRTRPDRKRVEFGQTGPGSGAIGHGGRGQGAVGPNTTGQVVTGPDGTERSTKSRTGLVVAAAIGVVVLVLGGFGIAIAAMPASDPGTGGGSSGGGTGGGSGGGGTSPIETTYRHYSSVSCDMDSDGLGATCSEYGPSDVSGVTATFTDHEGSSTALEGQVDDLRSELESAGTLQVDDDYHDGAAPDGTVLGHLLAGSDPTTGEYVILVTDDLAGTSMQVASTSWDDAERVATDQIESTSIPTADGTFGATFNLGEFVDCWPNLDMFLPDASRPVSYDCWATTMGAPAPEIQARFSALADGASAQAAIEEVLPDVTVLEQGPWSSGGVDRGYFASFDIPETADGYTAGMMWTHTSEPSLLGELIGTDHATLEEFWSSAAG